MKIFPKLSPTLNYIAPIYIVLAGFCKIFLIKTDITLIIKIFDFILCPEKF